MAKMGGSGEGIRRQLYLSNNKKCKKNKFHLKKCFKKIVFRELMFPHSIFKNLKDVLFKYIIPHCTAILPFGMLAIYFFQFSFI